jgi:hypothetical protein
VITGSQLETVLRRYGIELVTKAQWGARPFECRSSMPTPSPRFYDHHAAVESTDDAQEVRAHQQYHMDHNGWCDIAYNFLIPDPATGNLVYEGRGVGVSGGHTQGENTESHAVCILGNFERDRPAATTLELAAKLMAAGIKERWWSDDILGHRDAPGASTSCPGKYWYEKLPWLRTRVDQILAGPTPSPLPPKDWFDMATKADLKEVVNSETSPLLIRPTRPDGSIQSNVFIVRNDFTAKFWIGDWDAVAIIEYVSNLLDAGAWNRPFNLPALLMDQIPELENPVLGFSYAPKDGWREALAALRPQ